MGRIARDRDGILIVGVCAEDVERGREALQEVRPADYCTEGLLLRFTRPGARRGQGWAEVRVAREEASIPNSSILQIGNGVQACSQRNQDRRLIFGSKSCKKLLRS